MWLIVGLGNPGPKYTRTRHNAGFMVTEAIARRLGLEFRTTEAYRSVKGSIGGNACILMEPLTFMNRSGIVVRDLVKRYAIAPENLIVIHDDIDMETGRIRIRKRGSSGGHKGVESVIQNIGTRDFIRIKIGIGREEGEPVEDYVLGRFRKDEMPLLREAVKRAADAVETILTSGVDRAMNEFN